MTSDFSESASFTRRSCQQIPPRFWEQSNDTIRSRSFPSFVYEDLIKPKLVLFIMLRDCKQVSPSGGVVTTMFDWQATGRHRSGGSPWHSPACVHVWVLVLCALSQEEPVLLDTMASYKHLFEGITLLVEEISWAYSCKPINRSAKLIHHERRTLTWKL